MMHVWGGGQDDKIKLGARQAEGNLLLRKKTLKEETKNKKNI